MVITWGDDLAIESKGLDVLGARRFDQAIEGDLVNGITTVSQRARYFSILTWAIGFHLMEIHEVGFKWDDFMVYLQRVEFVTLAASHLDKKFNRTDERGAVGKNLHDEKLKALLNEEAVMLPEGESGRMLGTYLAPCRAIGLVIDGNEATPYQLTGVGQKIYELRNNRLRNSPILEALKGGGEVTAAQVKAVIPEFSLGSLAACKDESTLIYNALVKSKDANTASGEIQHPETSNSFNSTVSWATQILTDQQGSAGEVISQNFFRSCTLSRNGPPVVFQWSKYEYLRRCHLALELILSSVAESLDYLDEATIAQVVSYWIEDFEANTALDNIWSCAEAVRRGSASRAIESLQNCAYFEGPIAVKKLHDISMMNRPYAAIALLAVTANSTQSLRSSGAFEPNMGSPGEQAIDIIETTSKDKFSDLMIEIVELTVDLHLETTFRKMGGGQKCSLRLFPEGSILRSTGLSFSPGHSNDRLSNVLKIFTDIGRLAEANGKYSATDASEL